MLCVWGVPSVMALAAAGVSSGSNASLPGGAATTVNAALLTSEAPDAPVSLMRTLPLVVAVEGTVHAYAPAAAPGEATTVVYVPPPSLLYSIFTFVTPFDVQVIFCVLPAAKFSPPFGALTVMLAAGPASPGMRKSFTTAMCCMLVAPLSV